MNQKRKLDTETHNSDDIQNGRNQKHCTLLSLKRNNAHDNWIDATLSFLTNSLHQHAQPNLKFNTTFEHTLRLWTQQTPDFCGLGPFLNRLSSGVTSVSLTVEAMVMSLIYLDKLIRKGLLLRVGSSDRVFLATLLLAYKWMDDGSKPVSAFSGVSGIPARTLVAWETTVWGWLDHQLYVHPAAYQRCLSYLAASSALC